MRVLLKRTNCEEARLRLTNYQLKDKSASKKITGATLRITKKSFKDEEFPHELVLTTRQKTKIINGFPYNILKGKKLSISSISYNQSIRKNFCAFFGKLAGPLIKFSVPTAKNILPPLATIAYASAVDGAISRKMRRRGVVRAGE